MKSAPRCYSDPRVQYPSHSDPEFSPSNSALQCSRLQPLHVTDAKQAGNISLFDRGKKIRQFQGITVKKIEGVSETFIKFSNFNQIPCNFSVHFYHRTYEQAWFSRANRVDMHQLSTSVPAVCHPEKRKPAQVKRDPSDMVYSASCSHLTGAPSFTIMHGCYRQISLISSGAKAKQEEK